MTSALTAGSSWPRRSSRTRRQCPSSSTGCWLSRLDSDRLPLALGLLRAALPQVVRAEGEPVRRLLRCRGLELIELAARRFERLLLGVGARAHRDLLARYEHDLPDRDAVLDRD